MGKLDRYTIDDGHHLLELVIDEDATHAARATRFRGTCSCGLTHPDAMSQAQIVRKQLDHIDSKLGPSKGPAWLPVGVRIVLLMLAMTATAVGTYAAGTWAADAWGLSGTGAKALIAGSCVIGQGRAFGLMVSVRRYIAPTKGFRGQVVGRARVSDPLPLPRYPRDVKL